MAFVWARESSQDLEFVCLDQELSEASLIKVNESPTFEYHSQFIAFFKNGRYYFEYNLIKKSLDTKTQDDRQGIH